MDKCFCPKAWNYYVFSLILFQYIHYELYTCVGVFFSCNDIAKNTYCSTHITVIDITICVCDCHACHFVSLCIASAADMLTWLILSQSVKCKKKCDTTSMPKSPKRDHIYKLCSYMLLLKRYSLI